MTIMPCQRRMTIADIARESGVSKSTVSRALNNSGYVSKEAREKIATVVKGNNYYPSAIARSLSKQQTDSIGVIIPEPHTQFFAEILSGISSVVDEYGLTLLFCNTDNDKEKEKRALSILGEHNVRGIILTPATDNMDKIELSSFLSNVTKVGVPVIQIDRPIKEAPWDGIYYDNFASSYNATISLIKEGYNSIAFITAHPHVQIAHQRTEGYKRALLDHGFNESDFLIYQGDWNNETSYKITQNLLNDSIRPEAIINANSMITAGVVRAFLQNNVVLGRDVGFINWGASETLDILGVDYSFIDRETYHVGETAIKMLLERIDNPNLPQRINVLPPKIVLGDYCRSY